MVYLSASIKLYPGKLQDFITLLNDISPMLARHRWKLLGSFSSVVGRLNTALDLWELPDSNAVHNALADPEFQKFAGRIKEIVEDETLAILTKLPIG
ncbi:MAG: NIPSNAP family protein [Candidatus Binataceae bacterium]